MTEKRFTLELYEGTIRIKAIKDYGEIIYPPKIVELLNELHEENIKLKKQMKRLYNYFEDFFSGEIGNNDFSEMWDFVAEDEKWD